MVFLNIPKYREVDYCAFYELKKKYDFNCKTLIT